MIEAAKCDMALSNSEESQKLLLKITKKFSRTQNFIVCYNYTENIKSRKPSKYQDNWQILHQNFLALQGPLVKKSYHLSSHILRSLAEVHFTTTPDRLEVLRLDRIFVYQC